MLAIQRPKNESTKCSPNLLPCAVHHNGDVEIDERHWNPKTQEDGTSIVYLRGRKLMGKKVDVPSGYEGIAVRRTNDLVPATDGDKRMGHTKAEKGEEEGDEEEEDTVETKSGEQTAQFDHLMVWDHAVLPSEADDPYTRGIHEWVAFAETMHAPVEVNTQLQPQTQA